MSDASKAQYQLPPVITAGPTPRGPGALPYTGLDLTAVVLPIGVLLMVIGFALKPWVWRRGRRAL